jgi:single-strand DNA-binding protein
MNTVHICGNIGAEPEFRLFDSGKRKVSLSVALNQYKKDGEQLDTIWIPCQAWDAVSDRLLKCQQRGKLSGRKINITGTFTQSKWTDQTTGRQHSKLIVKIQAFELLSGPPESMSASGCGAGILGKPAKPAQHPAASFRFKSSELRAAKEDARLMSEELKLQEGMDHVQNCSDDHL